MSTLLYRIALSLINSVGPITAKQLVSYCGSAKSVFTSPRKSLLKIPGIGPKTVDEIQQKKVLQLAERELGFIERNNIGCYFYLDENYPRRLKAFNDSPIMLYLQGENVLNSRRTVGIVGSRKPTPSGKTNVEKLVEQLGAYNPVIISGLAYGVDALAHRQALENNIPTIGVMGNGLASTYPASHQGLRKKMLKNGGIITEFISSTKPEREHFPMRNRIIAALSDALIVIESARKGGSMITAQFAFSYNKDVFAIPGRPTDEMAAGPNFLIKSNVAALAEEANDIAYKMLWEKDQNQENKQMELFSELDEREQRIISIVNASTKEDPSIEYIHYESKMNLSELSSILLTLELKGIIQSIPGSRFRVK